MTFSKRQEQIFELICEGRTNIAIAQRLDISAATVKTHLQRMFVKTNTHNKAALVNYVNSQR